MRTIGMDIHRSFAQVAILEDGTITRELRVELVHEPLVAFAKALSLDDVVVIEVTGNSAAVNTEPVYLSDQGRNRVIERATGLRLPQPVVLRR
jgi:hypothetical protein